MCHETKLSHARREYARGVNDGATRVEQRAQRFTTIAVNGVETREGRVYFGNDDDAAKALVRAVDDHTLPKGKPHTFKPKARDGKAKDPALVLGATCDLDNSIARVQRKCQGVSEYNARKIMRTALAKRGALPVKPVRSTKANQRSRAATAHFVALLSAR